MTTVHPIDTSAASRWALVGLPAHVLRYADTGEAYFFVQRSWMRGRPWLRFCLRFEPSSHELWHVTAWGTKRAALAGDYG